MGRTAPQTLGHVAKGQQPFNCNTFAVELTDECRKIPKLHTLSFLRHVFQFSNRGRYRELVSHNGLNGAKST